MILGLALLASAFFIGRKSQRSRSKETEVQGHKRADPLELDSRVANARHELANESNNISELAGGPKPRELPERHH